MAKLRDLPTEILSHIVSYVAFDNSLDGAPLNGRSKDDKGSVDDDDVIGDLDEFRDLYNLCFVSRKFRDLAQPLAQGLKRDRRGPAGQTLSEETNGRLELGQGAA